MGLSRGVWGVTWVYLGSAGCKMGPYSGVRGVMALRLTSLLLPAPRFRYI